MQTAMSSAAVQTPTCRLASSSRVVGLRPLVARPLRTRAVAARAAAEQRTVRPTRTDLQRSISADVAAPASTL